jgi:HEPN domain-containing protein
MKAATAEWVEKAEGDFRSARRELRVRSRPNHDLEELLDALLPVAPQLETFRKGLASLTDHAVDFRYPDESATREVAKAAFANCRAVREEIRRVLGLDGPPSTQMSLRIKEKRGRYKVQRKGR